MKIVIVGGGVIGAATAMRLAGGGLSVDVVDAGEDRRASAGSLAWLNVSSTQDGAYARLRAASMRLWRSLGGDPPAMFRGTLLWFDDDRDMAADAAALQAIGWPASAIGPEETLRLAPGLAAPAQSTLWAPDEGVADPRAITDWFRAQAASAGARFHTDEAVAVETAGGRATGVRLASGEAIDADEVIVAAGCGGAALLSPLGVDIPLRDAPGALVITEPAPALAGPALATPALDFWQAADGRFLIGTGPDVAMAPEPERIALDTLASAIPATSGLRAELVRHRMRPIPGDGFPAIGRASGLPNLFIALTHSGMTLAPIIAETAHALMAGDPPPTDLAPWRPDRDYAANNERRRA